PEWHAAVSEHGWPVVLYAPHGHCGRTEAQSRDVQVFWIISEENAMKLVTFTHAGQTRIGAVLAEEVVDVSGQGRNVPNEMVTFLGQGAPALEQAREACASGRGRLALA